MEAYFCNFVISDRKDDNLGISPTLFRGEKTMIIVISLFRDERAIIIVISPRKDDNYRGEIF